MLTLNIPVAEKAQRPRKVGIDQLGPGLADRGNARDSPRARALVGG